MDEIMPGTVLGNYTIIKETGHGTFSRVFVATNNTSGVKCALKIIPKNLLDESFHKNMIDNELSIYKSIDFPLICEFYEDFFAKDFFVVSLEFVENGNLRSYVNRFGKLDEDEARHYFIQLLKAVEYLHTRCRVAHRDIKAENVLIDKNHNIRLIDFGLSHRMTMKQPTISGQCGSTAYASPEVIKRAPFTPASDIWSCGVFLYAITFGYLPFVNEDVQRLTNKILFTEPNYSGASQELKDLLAKMLKKDPTQRISLREIWNNPWVMRYKGIKELSNISKITRLPITDSVFNQIETKKTKEELEESIKKSERSQEVSAYKMLRRKEVTDELKPFSRFLNEEMLHANDLGDVYDDFLDSSSFSSQTKVFSKTLPRPSSISALPLISSPTSSHQKAAGKQMKTRKFKNTREMKTVHSVNRQLPLSFI